MRCVHFSCSSPCSSSPLPRSAAGPRARHRRRPDPARRRPRGRPTGQRLGGASGIEQVRISRCGRGSRGPARRRRSSGRELDGAIDRVAGAGLEPILTITGPGPLWTSRRAERGDPRYDPDPGAFADFAREVAARYGDRVDTYILWNEPNLSTWLRPQASCSRGCTSVAPHLYRGLVRAAYPAVHAADAGATVLIGTMSSRGGALTRENSTHRPLAFLRALGCVDSSVQDGAQRPLQGLQARHRRRLRLPPARRPDRARQGLPARRRRLARLAAAARERAGQDPARRRAEGDHAPLQPLHRRVRLPDQPARPHLRRLRRRPRTRGCSAPPTRPGATRA